MKRRPSGARLLRVALVSDTHCNVEEDSSASPYPANAEANPRARFVFDRIERTGADLCIHLGDMVNPVPELPTYGQAAERFHDIAGRLSMPLHLMPGNHDIGDKPVAWMPAGTVDAETIARYRRHFGPDHFSLDHGDCHFVVLNAPLVNSGLPEEAEQAAWLEADLAASAGKRVFLFSHYPPYVSDPTEPGSYDNIDEPGRSWLLGLIRAHRPEALFCAHVHNFWYDVIGETEFYVVPSTCFVRHDYAELYRIDGGDQKGRNDAAKLGHVTLDIFERGHVARYHRSHGATLAEGAGAAPPPVPRPHAKTGGLDRLFVDMRHAWAEELVVAPSGAVDEFRRKRARNDYPVMALWEMGLRGLRVPLEDLADARVRRRMALMQDVGHLFHVYRYGLPDAEERRLLAENAGLVGELELVLGWSEVPSLAGEIEALRAETGIPVILSRVNRKDAAKHAGGRYNHLISHGFTLEELEELRAFLAERPGLVDGVQVTIPRSRAPWAAARALESFAREAGTRAVLYAKSTEASPAEAFEDEAANARRFAGALLASVGFDVGVILDTFDDMDRGYFTRTGLVDRRFNPRAAGELVAALALAVEGGDWRAAEGDAPRLVDGGGRALFVGTAAEVPPGARWSCPATGQEGGPEEAPGAPSELLVIHEGPAAG
jgi:predicted phosphodiesterase